MTEVREDQVIHNSDQILDFGVSSFDEHSDFSKMTSLPESITKLNDPETALSSGNSDQKVDDVSSPATNCDFHMTLRSPKAHSRKASTSQMTPKSAVKVEDNEPAASFHMSLRSPRVYEGASASKLQKMSHKKASPAKPSADTAEITVSDTIDDNEADIVPAVPSKRVSPYKQGDVIPPSTSVVIKLFKRKIVHQVRNTAKTARKSSLYEPTKSTIVKQRLRSSSKISATSSETISNDKVLKRINVTRRPTIPVTPKFKSEERSRMHSRVLSTDEREALELEEEMKAEVARVRNVKKVFQWAKSNTSMKTQKSTKELTIPTTPVSHLTKKLGHKTCSIETGTVQKEEPKLKDESFQNKPLTQFEPFQFAISRKSARTGKF